MNFILDGMLGKLTRWLRMMGHDAKYSTSLDDPELLAIAKNEKRVLLTRDLTLYQQAAARGVRAFYVGGNTQSERLAELAKRFEVPLQIEMKRSRCPKCNTKLAVVAKEDISTQVEKNTLAYYDTFWKCSNCGAVYWQGAHWTKIQVTLDEAKEKLKKEN